MKAYRTGQGSWQLNFTFEGKYCTLYLGRRCSPEEADSVSKLVGELLSCRSSQTVLSSELLFRVNSLPSRICSSLGRLGLFRNYFGLSIDDLYRRFLKSKSYKKTTVAAYLVSQQRLNSYFGFERSISTISQDDVKEFFIQLSLRLSECTMSRLFRYLKTVFKFAVDEGLLLSNPFSMKVYRTDTNEERQFYVSRDAAFHLLPFFCNDRERLAFVLGRFAGLRIPSELVGLRFRDFDLAERVICIGKDTKTGAREVPLFREILDIFVTLRGEPNELVFGGWKDYRIFLLRSIQKSGMELWEKLWVNLRSSCITDLCRLGYDERTLDSIFGNSSLVRKLHYIQFERRRAYAKVLEDNERLYSDVSVTNIGQQDFALLLQEVRLLRKLLVERGFLDSSLVAEGKD